MSYYSPDSETGYYDDDDPLIQAQDEAHEAVEEARYLEELQAAHSPESDPDSEIDHREFVINMARQARSITANKEAA